MIPGELLIGHRVGHANLGNFPAARRKSASFRDFAGFGRVSCDRRESSGIMSRIGQAGHQGLSIGMCRSFEELRHHRGLDNTARIHDGDPIDELSHDAEVMRDEQD